MVTETKRSVTPEEYVKDWSQSDRPTNHDLKWLNVRMQERWPGNYKVIAELCPTNSWLLYKFKFDSPKDETLFRLKY